MKNTIFLLIILFTSVTSSARIGWQRGGYRISAGDYSELKNPLVVMH